MQVRNAIVAVTVAAFALTLSACSSDSTPTPTGPGSPAPTAAPTAAPTDAPTEPGTPAGEIRPLQDGFSLDNVANTLRSGFPSFADKSNDEIVTILNAGCDGIDAKGTPQAGADAIQAYGIEVYDAAFSLTASISLYCPEYAAFLKGDGTANG